MIQHEYEIMGKTAKIVHYADLLKYVARQYFDWDGEKDEAGRSLLQYIGTNLVRERDSDYWVKMLNFVIKMFFSDYDYVIIPDTRFPNEIEFWKPGINCADLTSVHIQRRGFESELTDEQKTHASETALDGYRFDYYLYAVTLNDLQEMAFEFCQNI